MFLYNERINTPALCGKAIFLGLVREKQKAKIHNPVCDYNSQIM